MCILLRIIAFLKSLPVCLFVLSLFVSAGIGVDVLIGAIVLAGFVEYGIYFTLGRSPKHRIRFEWVSGGSNFSRPSRYHMFGRSPGSKSESVLVVVGWTVDTMTKGGKLCRRYY